MKKFLFLTLLFSANVLSAARMSFFASSDYIAKAFGDHFSISEPFAFLEIRSGDKVIARSAGQTLGGNKSKFYFEIKEEIKTFPVNVVFCVGEKKDVERSYRAAIGGGAGAGVGALIGGIAAGVCSGGLGAPAGAAIGAAIGGLVGGGAGALAPIREAKEVASFYIKSPDDFKGEHTETVKDILSQEKIRLVIE